jgi:hypothetical protein
MSISSLSSQYISASFAGLVQYSSSNNIYDGNGSQITTLNVTASYASSGTTTAVGSEGSVQYKSLTGVLAGDANFVYNRTLSSLLIGSENQASGSHSFAAGESVIASGGNSAAFNFDTEAKNFDCCKMDIEGAEMLILENTNKVFNKLVYEWSFDIDDSLPRFWNIIEKHKKEYNDLKDVGNTGKFKSRDYDVWQKSWFPACTNVFAFNK